MIKKYTDEELFYAQVAFEAYYQSAANSSDWDRMPDDTKEKYARMVKAARAAVYVDPIKALVSELYAAADEEGSDGRYTNMAKRMYELGARAPKESGK